MKKIIMKVMPYSIFKKVLVIREKFKVATYYLGNKGNIHYYHKYKAQAKYAYERESNCSMVHKWGEAFCDYNLKDDRKTITLMWTEDPIPGNFGDWLSPYIVSRIANVNVRHISGVDNNDKNHLIALGSVIDCSNKQSLVIGAGIDNKNAIISKSAKYLSVRGPYTAKRLKECTGKVVSNFGDIGFLLRRVYKPKESVKKNDVLFVRHTNHIGIEFDLPEGWKEKSIFAAKPGCIESLIDEIYNSKLVVTSAMHCFIACVSYGVPVKLISFNNESLAVPGDGVKYLDALAGVGLKEISPSIVDLKFDVGKSIDQIECYCEEVSCDVLDTIEKTIHNSVAIQIQREG